MHGARNQAATVHKILFQDQTEHSKLPSLKHDWKVNKAGVIMTTPPTKCLQKYRLLAKLTNTLAQNIPQIPEHIV